MPITPPIWWLPDYPGYVEPFYDVENDIMAEKAIISIEREAATYRARESRLQAEARARDAERDHAEERYLEETARYRARYGSAIDSLAKRRATENEAMEAMEANKAMEVAQRTASASGITGSGSTCSGIGPGCEDAWAPVWR